MPNPSSFSPTRHVKSWFSSVLGFDIPNKRHAVVRASAFITIVLVGITCFLSTLACVFINPRTHPMEFLDKSVGDTWTRRANGFLALSALHITFSTAQVLFFFRSWRRNLDTRRSSIILLSFVCSKVVFSALALVLSEFIASMDVEVAPATETPEDYPNGPSPAERYSNKVTTNRIIASVSFALSMIDGIVQVMTVVFWLRLLPDRWRVPSPYEPVVSNFKSGSLLDRAMDGGQEELVNISVASDFEPGTPRSLAYLYEKHERLRRETLKEAQQRRKLMPPTSRRRGGEASASRASQRAGPTFQPSIYYWSRRGRSSTLRWLLGVLIPIFALPSTIVAASAFLDPERPPRDCGDYRFRCYLGITTPALYLAIALLAYLLVAFGVSPDVRLFRAVRADVVICVMFIISGLLSVVVLVMACITLGHESEDDWSKSEGNWSERKQDWDAHTRDTIFVPMFFPFFLAGLAGVLSWIFVKEVIRSRRR